MTKQDPIEARLKGNGQDRKRRAQLLANLQKGMAQGGADMAAALLASGLEALDDEFEKRLEELRQQF